MPTINIRHDYTIEVPEYGSPLDTDQIRSIVTRSGSHFFDEGTMRWFRSRLDSESYAGKDGWYFVTSEKNVPPPSFGPPHPREYTVRCLRLENYDGKPGIELYELGVFQEFKTITRARTAAKKAAIQGAPVCPRCHIRLLKVWEHESNCPDCVRYARQDAEREIAKVNT